MNKAKLKTYAPQARKDFIAAVTARAHRLGLSDNNGQLQITPAEKSGDLVIIAGHSWPAKISRQRDNLIGLMHKHGFAQTLENVAYTWFNRFAALRYMEIHDYLNHGYRVLSSREGGLPEILGHAPELAQNGDLPGLNPQRAIELKLAGDQDGELYRLTLIAQCNALSNAIPFLFERIDDETELLLPDNLLLTDSVIAKLVDAIPEEDWSQVEIIGWLYQFYISEKKDQVIGKVVTSEDIPAATQLFTPNWIVQYLVQNSIGRLWLMANPASTLKSEWPYYIEPAEQDPEVQAQFDALIQTRMAEDGGSLNPESITVFDPACGSGHILVEAYEVLKAIYLERGYQARNIPRLILEKNLYGLDIDDRAAQMAGFALLMKARADDRRLLDKPPKLNVLALQASRGLDAVEYSQALNTCHAELVDLPSICQVIDTFVHAKTFGSLIQIPPELNEQLPKIEKALQHAVQSSDLFTQSAAFDLLPLVKQAQMLGMTFDAVVANPPYMGGKGMNSALKEFAKKHFPDSKSDMFSMFMERCQDFGNDVASLSFVTPYVWMFISSYEGIRTKLLNNATLQSLIQLEYNAFEPACVPVCTFVVGKTHIPNYTGSYIKLSDFKGHENQAPKTLEAIKNPDCGWFFNAKPDDFKKISGSPVAYWANSKILDIFKNNPALKEVADARQGLATTDNARFLRLWYEIDIKRISFGIKNSQEAQQSGLKWFPHNKGGSFRKWYGNQDFVIDWKNDGESIKENILRKYTYLKTPEFVAKNPNYYFRSAISWSEITSSTNAFRFYPNGFIFNIKGMCAFPSDDCSYEQLLSLCNSKFASFVAKLINPTLSFGVGDFNSIPATLLKDEIVKPIILRLIEISKTDWNNYETSWDFTENPLICQKQPTLKAAFEQWQTQNCAAIDEMKRLEEENNRLFIEAYDLQDELSPEVPEEQITLVHADREKDGQRLISYAIGCMMGRYSLDEPGLIYAHAGNVGFDPIRYSTFPADTDGIVPITDELWFEDDAANRIREFLLAVWSAETLDENLAWLAETLGQKSNETPEETIRRYLASSFFKDHLQTYKKRPIYWLFSSGKQGAFQALVYLHRYHEGTLARMRAEYVVPLTGKIQSRIEMLKKDADTASSNAARSKLNKEKEKLEKKHVELLAYDEKLRHYADLRIQLDLDDGVKVNYGKFGDLLAEVKIVTGGGSDD